jgi:hypothetical protein
MRMRMRMKSIIEVIQSTGIDYMRREKRRKGIMKERVA